MSKISAFFAGALLAASVSTAGAASAPIVGNWRTASGETAAIVACGKGVYCVTLVTGQHKGQRIGVMSGSGANYAGKVTDPNNGKTYEGTAAVNGNALKLTGCALKIFCKSQRWSRK
ncbi:DUF2147 domain-containing protein [Jiella sp. MQZ9-1]|uniref:DUF2147 domain-containing protein n=1 Tax=Jiella flava TaxID=2816857 RepID=A0A939FVB6_9HYPH|nr:DUF2147 domain-containing protein [Jiella flava]MBO0662172.1 DUF2147 domain-containing protein [Jiella flava]MCD2470998.1 DUF2147 domain-containing protein [Jiella flava]